MPIRILPSRSFASRIPAVAGTLLCTFPMMAVAEQAEQAEHGGGNALLRFDPGVGIWAIAVFVLLLLLLKKMAWKPILDSLDARDHQVKQSLDQAQRIQAENARIASEQARLLEEARKEASSLMQSAREASEEARRKAEVAANEQKTRIMAQATSEIEAQKQAAVRELRQTTAELSIQIAGKLIEKNMDEDRNRILVDKLISELGSGKA